MDLNCTKQSSEEGDRKGTEAEIWDTQAASCAAATTIKLHRKIVYLSANRMCRVWSAHGGWWWWSWLVVSQLGAAETIKLHLHFSGENETELNEMKQRKLQKRAPKSMQQLLFSNISFSSRFSLCFYRERNASSPFLLIRHTVHIIVMPKLLSVRCVEQKLWYQFTASWSVALALQAD